MTAVVTQSARLGLTSEAYDAVMMLGHAAMMEDGENMGMHMPMVGVGVTLETVVLTHS